MKWKSNDKKKKYSLIRFFKGFKYAFNGFIQALKTEQNFLIEIIYGLLTIILGFILKLSSIEFCIVLLAIALVLSTELINTSIENTVDMAMTEIHPLAKTAKDLASSAVLISSIIAFIIGLIIYVPKVISLI